MYIVKFAFIFGIQFLILFSIIMSDKETSEIRKTTLLKWKNFQHLSKTEMQLVSDNMYEASFNAGEIIIKQGSPASSVIFLFSGIAKSYTEGQAGKNFILGIILPGSLLMGPGAYINSRNTFTVAAINPVQTCFIDFGIFRQLIKTNSAFAEGLLEELCSNSIRLQTKMVNLAQKKMPGRLAEALLYLAEEVFHSDEYRMVLTRKELGEMTNMAKESVIRIMREMEESGVISTKSSEIRILDKDKLRLISEKG
jgi:CRP-like cAMP-binding protein